MPAISSFLAAVLIPLVGYYFTNVQEQRNADIKEREIQNAKVDVITKFLPYLEKKEESQKLAAISMIYTMGYQEPAIILASLNPVEGTARFLGGVAVSPTETIKRQCLAYESLNSLATSPTIKKEIRKQADSEIIRIEKTSVQIDSGNELSLKTILEQKCPKFPSEVQEDIPLEVVKQPRPVQGQWGIIIGANKTFAAAEDEVKAAIKEGISKNEVQIYQRNDWFRTVIIFSNREQAEEKISKPRTIPDSAYIVNFNSWCPKKAKVEEQNYFQCS